MRNLLLTLLAAALAGGVLASGAALATADRSPATATLAKKRNCDRNYSGRCLKPNAYDYDCAGGSGNGPYYVSGPFRVVGTDRHRLDSDHDGIACES